MADCTWELIADDAPIEFSEDVATVFTGRRLVHAACVSHVPDAHRAASLPEFVYPDTLATYEPLQTHGYAPITPWWPLHVRYGPTPPLCMRLCTSEMLSKIVYCNVQVRGSVAYLSSLRVRSKLQGNGWGTGAVMTALSKLAHAGVSTVFIEARPTDPGHMAPLLLFYRRCGFRMLLPETTRQVMVCCLHVPHVCNRWCVVQGIAQHLLWQVCV